MLPTIRKATAAVAMLGASADSKSGSSAKPQRDALTGTTAAKVKAAALENVPGVR